MTSHSCSSIQQKEKTKVKNGNKSSTIIDELMIDDGRHQRKYTELFKMKKNKFLMFYNHWA